MRFPCLSGLTQFTPGFKGSEGSLFPSEPKLEPGHRVQMVEEAGFQPIGVGSAGSMTGLKFAGSVRTLPLPEPPLYQLWGACQSNP